MGFVLALALLLFSLACFKLRYSLYRSGKKTHTAVLSFTTIHNDQILKDRDIFVLKCLVFTHSGSRLELDQCHPGDERTLYESTVCRNILTKYCVIVTQAASCQLTCSHLVGFPLVLLNESLLPTFQH